MKQVFKSYLLFCLVVCLLPLYALAANNTYNLDELGMSIEIPSDFVVFTRDIKADDSTLNTYGLTRDGLSALMIERSIYLNAWDDDINYEIIITMTDSPLVDHNLLSDTMFAVVVSSFETEYANTGITFIRSEIYQHSQAKFAKIYISQPNNGETAYGLQYHTVYNGKAINITMQSYSGEIDSNREEIIQKIVDTIHFDTEPQFSAPPAQTKAFTYTDKDSGMTFTVPANWVESPMNEEREYIDVKFTSNLEEGLCIIFSSQDVYELEEFKTELSATDQLLLTRDVIGNDIFTKADIAEMYGCNEKDVSMVTCGGKEYYSAAVVTSSTAYGLTFSTPMVYLVRCENGYMYVFQFNGAKDNPYYGDFVALLNSIKYPVVQDTHKQSAGIAFIAMMAITIVIVILLTRRRKQRKSNQANIPPQRPNEVPVPIKAIEPISNEPEKISKPVVFCHKCGCKLECGSRFCHKCGTMIPTKEEE